MDSISSDGNWAVVLLSIFVILLAIGPGMVRYGASMSDNSSAIGLGSFVRPNFTVDMTLIYDKILSL